MKWTMDSTIGKVSNPYSPYFPTIIDLMPLMSFQQAQDGDLGLCSFLGSVSVSLGSARDETKSKEHDITYTISSTNPKKTVVKFDTGNPVDNIKQKTLWKQVLNDLGAEFKELNIDGRIPVLETPSKFDFGFDYLLPVQIKTGNFTNSLRRKFSLVGVRNPYLLMKNELKEKGLWVSEYSRKLRGVMRTMNLAGYDGKKLKGWDTFLSPPEGHRFNPKMVELNDSLISDRWWADNGIPARMLGAINSNEIEGIVYRLKRREAVITA